MLTRWLTEESIEAAKHGNGTWVMNPNTMTVVFTMNAGKIGYDLYDRLLPINLIVCGGAKIRAFEVDPVTYVKEHRCDIVGEVMGLAISCLNDDHWWSIPAGYDRRFERWMQVVGGLLELRGLPGFMKPTEDEQQETEEDVQQRLELLSRMCGEFKGAKFRAKDAVSICAIPPGMLFAGYLVGGQPEKSLSAYVLEPLVDQAHILPDVNEPGISVEVVLRKGYDRKYKSSCYWLETVDRAPSQGLEVPVVFELQS